jgi:hypothetical protein
MVGRLGCRHGDDAPAGRMAAFGRGRPFWDILINLFLLKIEMKYELWMILHENATKDVQ